MTIRVEKVASPLTALHHESRPFSLPVNPNLDSLNLNPDSSNRIRPCYPASSIYHAIDDVTSNTG